MICYHELTGRIALKENFWGRIILQVEEKLITILEADKDAPSEIKQERTYFRNADKLDLQELKAVIADSLTDEITKQ